MPEYTVRWEMEIDAAAAVTAAERALAVQRNPESTAVVFHVRPSRAPYDGPWQAIDLDDVGVAEIAIRDEAVRRVDERHGYTAEFAPSPDQHRAEYDAEEAAMQTAREAGA